MQRNEDQLRRQAIRNGLRLSKSRSHDPDAIDYGLYALVDPATGGTVNPAHAGRCTHSWTLDDVTSYLRQD
jgi:hypothetical protein